MWESLVYSAGPGHRRIAGPNPATRIMTIVEIYIKDTCVAIWTGTVGYLREQLLQLTREITDDCDISYCWEFGAYGQAHGRHRVIK